MSFLRHQQIYHPMCCFECKRDGYGAVPCHRLMSLRPAIPRRVALLHCSLPLRQPIKSCIEEPEIVNHHWTGAGEFSGAETGKFQMALTKRASSQRGVSRKGKIGRKK